MFFQTNFFVLNIGQKIFQLLLVLEFVVENFAGDFESFVVFAVAEVANLPVAMHGAAFGGKILLQQSDGAGVLGRQITAAGVFFSVGR